MLSHQNAIAQCHQLQKMTGPGQKKYLAQIPLFHSKYIVFTQYFRGYATHTSSVSGLVRFLSWPVFSNDECIMLPYFTLELFLKTIVEYQIEDLTLVPPLVIRLVKDPIVDQYDLSCVKRLSSSSAPLSPEIIQQLEKKMPWTGFRQSWGMTESCGAISTHSPEFYSYKYANSAGPLLPSTRIKIIDLGSGRELGPNEPGEIFAAGPQIAMGYLKNEKETNECFDADGFLHTGDVGSIDDAGFIHIVDRIKEMIKVKGQQVAPAELEDLLLGHPNVADCAVLGFPDDYSGERPRAYVVLRPGQQPSEAVGQELIRYVQEKRVRHKWITEVEFIDIVPKNPSGKILRRVLKEKAQKGERGFVVKDRKERSRL